MCYHLYMSEMSSPSPVQAMLGAMTEEVREVFERVNKGLQCQKPSTDASVEAAESEPSQDQTNDSD